jgi:putative membrane protein
MAFLFDRYYSGMYHFILGTVIGSSIAIFPAVVFPAFTAEGLAASGLSFIGSLAFCLILLIIGIIISWQFGKLEERVESQKAAEI